MITRLPFIIGEAASCHQGSLDRALQLTHVAKDAGCDAIKFQYWSNPARMRARRNIQDPTAYMKESIHETWLPLLREEAVKCDLKFIVSVFLPEDVDALAGYVDAWKISSFEARDRTLRDAIPHDNKPLIISTGMQQAHEDSYLGRRAYRLHCVSAYPCPPDQASLGAIQRGGGYSDHTACHLTGAFAVSAGADVLEVHFRLLDTGPECPDFPVSLDPEGLATYVKLARVAALMRGDGKKGVQEAERGNVQHRVVS